MPPTGFIKGLSALIIFAEATNKTKRVDDRTVQKHNKFLNKADLEKT